MSPYSITVENAFGETAVYILTSDLPDISGSGGQKWPIVIERARVPALGTAVFNVEKPDPYFAYAISSHGSPGHGNSVEVVSKRSVQLGRSNIQFSVDEGAPKLGDDKVGGGFENGFGVQTGTDFTRNDAKNGNWLIGFGNNEHAYAAFQVEPGEQYQIFPKNSFYLTSVDVKQGSLVDTTHSSKPLKLDFEELGSEVKVRHAASGDLVIDN